MNQARLDARTRRRWRLVRRRGSRSRRGGCGHRWRCGCSGSRRRCAVAASPSAVHAPAAAGGDRGDLLHVDVDELAGPFALVAANRLLGPVARSPRSSRPSPSPRRMRLHRRGGQADLVRDAVRAPPALAAQPHHPPATRARRSGSVNAADGSNGPTARRRPRRGTGRATCAPSWRRPGTAPRSPRSSSPARAHTPPSAGDPPGSAARSGAGF